VGYYLSSSVNPLLYSVMSKRFRRGFRDMFNRNKSLNNNPGSAGHQPQPANPNDHGEHAQLPYLSNCFSRYEFIFTSNIQYLYEK
jgi:hypothetical protein